MNIRLETLEMTPEELEFSKAAVHRMAYFNWIDARCPDGGELDFWLTAEREWIGSNYTPHRPLEVVAPAAAAASEVSPADDNRQQPSTKVQSPIADEWHRNPETPSNVP
jgi:Protein of unknown function (DUF2934)